MTEHPVDTHERGEPAGTPSPGSGDLTSRPVTPGEDDAGGPKGVPGTYDADAEEQARGREWKPGN